MPELPEVETVRTGLEAALSGAVIAKVALRRKDLRVPFPPELPQILAGKRITAIGRRAKYLLFYFDSEDVLIVHLGMSGRFSVLETPPAMFSAHDHLVFYLKDGRCVIFNDARRFGLAVLAQNNALAAHPLLAALGPEPFDKAFSTAYLRTALSRRHGPIKPVLMDQKLVVGVGNIYASEALFLSGIDPRKPASGVASSAKDIAAAIRRVLKDAIASGGSSLRDFYHITGDTGYFQHRFNVYGREGQPCFQCQRPLYAIRQAGRSTFFCAHCQR